jgi:hypothetical protein
MWTWILQNIIVSIVIIFLVHNLVSFLQDSYTTKKTKDVVGFHVQKYKSIMDEMHETNQKEKQEIMQQAERALKENDNSNKTDLSEKELRSMNEDLADFIQRQIAPLSSSS